MALDLSVPPYFDDFDESKKHIRVLFRPSYAVQARELTQLQTLIQKQIERFGRNIFKEGAMVIPGQVREEPNYPYAQILDEFNSVDVNVSQFSGTTVLGKTSGAIAYVRRVETISGAEPNTLYLKYITGTSSVSFTATISGTDTFGKTTLIVPSSNGRVPSDIFRRGSLVVGTGIPAGTYVLDYNDALFTVKLSNTVASVGSDLRVVSSRSLAQGEEIISIYAGQDQPISDLFGQNFTPYEATVGTSDSNNNAVGLGSAFTIEEGVFFTKGFFVKCERQTILISKYSSSNISVSVGLEAIENIVTSDDDSTLLDNAAGSPNENAPGADRYAIDLVLTKYDLEAPRSEDYIELYRVNNGNVEYIVDRSFYNIIGDEMARRTYDESGDYTVRPFVMDVSDGILDSNGETSEIFYNLSPGKAYVRGYEIETSGYTRLAGNKARDSAISNNRGIGIDIGLTVTATSLGNDLPDIALKPKYVINDGGSNQIGTTRIRGFQEESSGNYLVYLFDVEMNVGKSLYDAASIVIGGSSITLQQISGVTVVGDLNKVTPIFRSGQSFVKSATDINYVHFRQFNSVTPSGNDYVITVSGTQEFYIADEQFFEVEGNTVTNVAFDATSKQATITVSAATGAADIVAVVRNRDATAKTKTLTQNSVSINQNFSITPSYMLPHADIARIVSIVLDDSNQTDYTKNFILDNGQRDHYYGLGSISLASGRVAPPTSSNLVITYEYYSHSSGDFFNVNSYDTIAYQNISLYKSSVGEVFQLRDCFDFRPTATGVDSNGDFVFSGSTNFPYPKTTISADIEYYLGRIDLIYLTKEGTFGIRYGVSSLTPKAPSAPDNAMVLYRVYHQPYTGNAKRDTFRQFLENKRYTMRDIGKLENRIKNLEYYTSLNLLEQATENLFINDGNGLNRFKNGFFVDPFSTILGGDIENTDFKASIDTDRKEARPEFVNNAVNFDYSSGSSVQKTGDLITLPYTESAFIEQPQISSFENLQPFEVFYHIGEITLDPPSDFWKDTTIAPERTVDITNIGQSIEDLANIVNDSINFTDKKWDSWNLVSQSTENFSDGSKKIEKNYTRNGSQIVVESNNSTSYSLGNKVVDIEYLPYMRSIDIKFTAQGLKPNTRMFAFFNNIGVTEDCKALDWDTGEVVSESTLPANSGSDDLVIDSNNVADLRTLYTVELVTDSFGRLRGVFTVPEEMFLVGTLTFYLSDDPLDRLNFASTGGSAIFHSQGLGVKEEDTILSTRAPQFVKETLTKNRSETTIVLPPRPAVSSQAEQNYHEGDDSSFSNDRSSGNDSEDTVNYKASDGSVHSRPQDARAASKQHNNSLRASPTQESLRGPTTRPDDKDDSSSSSSSSRVLCTYYVESGRMLQEVLFVELEHAYENLTDTHAKGYWVWAYPLSQYLRKETWHSKIVGKAMLPLVFARTNEILYQMGKRDKPNYIGKALRFVLEPMCYAIGIFVNKDKLNIPKSWHKILERMRKNR